MGVLHGLWFDSTFHLWGELTPVDAWRRRAGVAVDDDGDRTTPHPGAMSAADLHAFVGELTPDGLLASIAGEAVLELWLPGDGPLPLPSLAAEGDGKHPTTTGEIELRRYEVPVLAFGPAEAIDLLVSLPSPGPRYCADTVQFYARLANYLSSLLSRQQFTPDMNEADTGVCTARWRVVVRQKEEIEWLQAFAEAMPPAARAVVHSGEDAIDPVLLVECFLHECADATIRRILGEDPFFNQIHERAQGQSPWELRWLAALMGASPVVRGDPQEHAAQAGRVRAWIGAIDESRRAIPTRLCLELLEPDEADDLEEPAGDVETADPTAPARTEGDSSVAGTWRIRFYLQSQDGTGELHDVRKVWAERGAAPTILRRRPADGREHLVAALTRAAEVCPLLDEALQREAPTGVDLSSTEAHAFLRDYAPLLEARGFGVRLPEWAQRPDRQLGLRLFVRPLEDRSDYTPAGRGVMGLNSIVDFEWRVAIGDKSLSLDEFERLRLSHAPLVRLRGEWIALDAEAARRASEYLHRHQRGRMTLAQALRVAGGAEDAQTGLPVFGLDGAAWIDRLLRESEGARIERLEQPAGFDGVLRAYQVRGLEWLAFMDHIGIGACLADDMGLGKTIQLIALLLHERKNNGKLGPTLVFAPMSVVGNWQREIERFAHALQVFVHHGPERPTGDAFVEAALCADAVITTYALGHRDLETLRRVPWRRIVLDEAQKIKNPSAAQTIAIRSLPAERRVALTGTPLENHLSELWSIMDMLNPGLLGSAAGFRKRFAVPIERMGDRQRAQQLKTMIRPFLLRRVKSDPDVECDLPEKMEMRVFCNLTAEQAALYEGIVADMLGEVERASGIRRRGVILAALTRLKQICNHPTQLLRDQATLDNRSGKCERLVEMLEEVIAEGDSALVFTQFREMGEILVRMLTDRLHVEVPFLHGGTSARQRTTMIDRFQDPGVGLRVFVLSLRAGGLGLNLTAANHVFHFDRWWNPAVEDQATDRAHRLGQVRRVQVHKFVCIGTIEDRIDRMLTEKVALADNIVGRGDDWLTGLSTEELRSYLTLSRDAIGEE